MNDMQVRGDLAEQGRFTPPHSLAHPFAARPDVASPEAIAAHFAAPARRPTLFAELHQARLRGAELEAQETSLANEARELAAQRDRLAARRSELEDQAATDRFDRMQAALSGTKLPKRSDASDSLEVIDAARAQVDADEAANAEKRVRLNASRAMHGQAESEIRWRIALARYASVAVQLLPLARELAELSRMQRRGFNWGHGLIIDATGPQDIAGVPLSIALELAANLGEPEAAQ